MSVDLFDSTYRNFKERVLADVRRATFGKDFGQNSWTTADEYERFATWLALAPDASVLEVASGSGGPALHLARVSGCRILGIDVNPHGVEMARRLTAELGLESQAQFEVGDATDPLPFEDCRFDAVVCIDSANHFPDRGAVLREWRRVLRPGGRLLYTDPVVVTGLVTAAELAARSSIGVFVFSAAGTNEGLLGQAGFAVLRSEDVTGNAALVSRRWRAARASHREALLAIEGAERYEGLQQFFATVHQLSSEHRLSRLALLARRAEP